jgi:hypothetical protein
MNLKLVTFFGSFIGCLLVLGTQIWTNFKVLNRSVRLTFRLKIIKFILYEYGVRMCIGLNEAEKVQILKTNALIF